MALGANGFYQQSQDAAAIATLGRNGVVQPMDLSGAVTVASITVQNLTPNRLVASDGTKTLASVANLQSWIAGTANQVITADDGDGTITLSLPQNIHTAATPQFAGATFTGSLAFSADNT